MMRNPLARLVHRDPARPTLRQRAASLKASAAKVMRRRSAGPDDAFPSVMPSLVPTVAPSGETVIHDLAGAVASALRPAESASALASSLSARAPSSIMEAIDAHRAARLALDAVAKASDPVAIRLSGGVISKEATDLLQQALNSAADAEEAAVEAILSQPPANATEAAVILRYLADEPTGLDLADVRPVLLNVAEVVAANLNVDPADVALFALETEFHVADDVVIAAYKALNEARDKYVELAMPIELNPWRGDWMHLAIPRPRTEAVGNGKFRSLPYGAEEVEQMRGRRCMRQTYGQRGELQPDGRRMEADAPVQERVDSIVAAWDQWQEAIEAAKDAAGIEKAREAAGKAKEDRASVLERIRDTPARTMADLGVKARLAASMNAVEDMKEEAREYDPDQPEALPYDIVGDVLGILATSLKSGATPTRICEPVDPLLSAIERYQTARAAGDAFSKRIDLEGYGALGGFDLVDEEDTRLARAWSRLATEVLETAPTTGAGRLALAAFIEMWVDDHGNLDGSPQDGAETVFAEVYPALLKALRASVSTRD